MSEDEALRGAAAELGAHINEAAIQLARALDRTLLSDDDRPIATAMFQIAGALDNIADSIDALVDAIRERKP